MPDSNQIMVGLVSDTHGSIDPRVLDALGACDQIVHAGDVGDASVLRQLNEAVPALHAVRGNNDPPGNGSGDGMNILEHLPLELRLALPGGELVVVHGDRVNPAARRHQRLRVRYPRARALVYGHSHRLVVDQAEQPWILNPGAAGRARTYGGPSCLRLIIDGPRWQVQTLRFPPRPARSRAQPKAPL